MTKCMLTILSAALFAICSANAAVSKPTLPNKTVHTQALRSQWPPETLSGKIATVDFAKNRVVVRDTAGTPFDFVVGPSTRIKVGSAHVKLSDVASKINDTVSVRYIPERKGDIAKSIEISQ
jgi:hypothetical protein